ncbi:MAG: ATP-binding cassette domain-containing protein [Planctomycetota bacterium]|nr:ATP-binding cassette domain-containing protein [Planctomycetota bacterium]MDA1179143.1 ATP-binding cassette domain-containing protein [Planctomycetota bacterium]
MSDAPVIEIANVSHTFRDRRALSNIAFCVLPGQLHGFVGPNGAGKTTTLKLVCTLLAPQTGTVRVFGQDAVADVRAVRKRLGYMPDTDK